MSHTGRGIPGVSGGAVNFVSASEVAVTTDSAGWTSTYLFTGSITKLFQNSLVPLQKSLMKSSDKILFFYALIADDSQVFVLVEVLDGINASDKIIARFRNTEITTVLCLLA